MKKILNRAITVLCLIIDHKQGKVNELQSDIEYLRRLRNEIGLKIVNLKSENEVKK